ncbi:MAG: hypothetical protein E7298_11690 [Lachnospiraceae bacterium]|nr:hypothetical protein [Lachnospiraceae bacterium]
MGGSFLQQLYNTVDAIIVGNFSGEDALSAVGTTGSFTFLFFAVEMEAYSVEDSGRFSYHVFVL